MNIQKARAGRYYRPELDVLRFVAFLFVFCYHTVPSVGDPRIAAILGELAPILYDSVMACRFGLSLFFTLSAFLICELLLRERETAGTVLIKQFYIRRILRIWPLYYLGLAVGVICAFLPGNHHGEIAQMGWFALFLGASYKVMFVRVLSPMGPLWSISVEEQFYLFIPWTIKACGRGLLYGLCLFLLVLSSACLYYLGVVHAGDNQIWSNSIVQFQCFAGGMLLCLLLHGRVLRISAWQRMLTLIASWACWFYAAHGLHFDFSNAYNNPGSWHLVAAYALGTCGSVLLLVAFLGVSPSVLPGWAIYLGRISFGLYVFHMLAFYITKTLLIGSVASMTSGLYYLKGSITIILTIVMAAFSYEYFEKPFLKLKERHEIIKARPS